MKGRVVIALVIGAVLGAGGGELPRTYIIRDGRVVFEHRGGAQWNSAQGVALLEKVIAGAG